MSVFERATTVDDAIDEVLLLAASLPGDFTITVEDYEDETVIEARGTLVASGCAVEIDLPVTEANGGVEVPS